MVYEYILDCVSCWITFQSAVCLQITMLQNVDDFFFKKRVVTCCIDMDGPTASPVTSDCDTTTN